jgi:predicted RNA binding protein YcfA (HicA-like mRNA interferase family)
MAASKDFKKMLREAQRQGWRVEQTKGGHWRLYAPDGEHIVHAAGTPSDTRSLDNTLAQMRRYGFVWKGR